jgi:hypothetical protein
MKKDCAYYESTLRKMLDEKYRLMAQMMLADGFTPEQISAELLRHNCKDVHEAIHIGEDPSTN